MSVYPIFLNDGTIIHEAEDLGAWLQEQGLSDAEVDGLFNGRSDDVLEANVLKQDRDEYERLADGYHEELQSLIAEVEAVCEKLESGKKSKGYTKIDLADALRYAIQCHEV